MSRRFSISKAKGGRESLRPSYGLLKLTLISREKNHLRRCDERLLGHNFALAFKWWPHNFRYTALFLLATGVLPAYPNFGQAKHGQNGPAVTFCQQGICCSIPKHHFTRWQGGRTWQPFVGSKMAMKIFFKRVFTIFASNALFLRLLANLQN